MSVLRRAPLPKSRGGHKVWRTQDLFALCDWFLEPPAELRPLLEGLIRRMLDDSDGGFGSGGGEKTSGGKYGDDGSNNGRTPNLALRRIENDRFDEVAMASRGFFNALESAAMSLTNAVKFASALAALPAERAKELAEEGVPERGAPCVNENCGRWIENTPNDRIRAGRCDACRKYRERSGGKERPRELCHPEGEAA